MKKLSTWLIIIGIVLISIPLAGKYYVKHKQDKLYKEYLAQLEASMNNQQDESVESDDNIIDVDNNGIDVDIMDENFNEAISRTEEEDAKKEKKSKPNLNAIGRIEISKIDVDLIMLEGSSQYNLIYGAGHMTGTAYPGDVGNCAVAGHRGYTFGTYFYRLDELETGDIIKITYGGKVYDYSVDESFLVLPTDVYVLAQPKDEKQLTLITCDPPVTGTHRLIIRASIIEE